MEVARLVENGILHLLGKLTVKDSCLALVLYVNVGAIEGRAFVPLIAYDPRSSLSV